MTSTDRFPWCRSHSLSCRRRAASSSASFSAGNASLPGTRCFCTGSREGGTRRCGWYRKVFDGDAESLDWEISVAGGAATSSTQTLLAAISLPPIPTGKILECELQHQFNDPRRRERVLDAAECRRVRQVGRTGLDREVRVVEQIERLDSERQVPLVGDGEVLSKPEVYVPVSGTIKDADARIAELSRRRGLEAGTIDPRVVDASAG